MADFYGIEIRSKLLVPNKATGTKQEYDLWLGGGFSDPDLPLILTDLSYVQDITIQLGLALNSKVSLTFTPPLEEGLELIHSPLLNWGGSELQVQIGYSTGGGLSRSNPTGTDLTLQSFGGLVMKPDVRIGQDVVITINALGVAYGLNLSHMTTKQTFAAGTTPWEAVQQTFMGFGGAIAESVKDENAVFGDDFPAQTRDKNNPNAHPFFLPVKAVHKQSVGATGNTTTDTFATISKGPRNDWWFIRETVKNYGLDMIIRDQQVLIRDPQSWKKSTPKFKFVLRGNLNTANDVDNKVYPILEFNTPSAYVWLANGSGGLLQSDISKDKKEELTSVITSSKTKSTRDPTQVDQSQLSSAQPSVSKVDFLGQFLNKGYQSWLDQSADKVEVDITKLGTGAVDSTGSSVDASQVFPGSPEDNAADQAIGEYRNYNHNRGIQADITTIGIPELLPSTIVYIDGIAPDRLHNTEAAWFDGPYGIMQVEHNIGTAGMTTKFKALKNFIPSDMQVATDNVGGDVNKSGPNSINNLQDGITVVPTEQT